MVNVDPPLPMRYNYSSEEIAEYIKARREIGKNKKMNWWDEYKIPYPVKCRIIWNPYFGFGLRDRLYVDKNNGDLHYHMIYPVIRFGYNKEHPEMSVFSQLIEPPIPGIHRDPHIVKCLYPFDVSERTSDEPDLPTDEDVILIFKKLVELTIQPDLGPIHMQNLRLALWNLLCTRFDAYAKYEDEE